MARHVNLVDAFNRFADCDEGFGMSNTALVRWFTDAGLLRPHGHLNSQHIDIAFYSVKKRGEINIKVHETELVISNLTASYARDIRATPREAATRMKYALSTAHKVTHNTTRFLTFKKRGELEDNYFDLDNRQDSPVDFEKLFSLLTPDSPDRPNSPELPRPIGLQVAGPSGLMPHPVVSDDRLSPNGETQSQPIDLKADRSAGDMYNLTPTPSTNTSLVTSDKVPPTGSSTDSAEHLFVVTESSKGTVDQDNRDETDEIGRGGVSPNRSHNTHQKMGVTNTNSARSSLNNIAAANNSRAAIISDMTSALSEIMHSARSSDHSGNLNRPRSRGKLSTTSAKRHSEKVEKATTNSSANVETTTTTTNPSENIGTTTAYGNGNIEKATPVSGNN